MNNYVISNEVRGEILFDMQDTLYGKFLTCLMNKISFYVRNEMGFVTY